MKPPSLASDRSTSARIALLIFALAWVLRFLYLLQIRQSPLFDAPMLDELYHATWARQLAAGDWVGSDVYFRAPLYPHILALTFAVFKESLLASRVFQITYGALTPVVVYFFGRRILDERGGRIAGVVAACYPLFIYFDSELLIVSLVVLLDLLMLLAIVRSQEVPSWGRWLGAGVVAGFSAIARPNVLVFAPFVFLWIWLSERRSGRSEGRGGSSAGSETLPADRAGSGARGIVVTLVRGRTPFATTLLRFVIFLLGAAIVITPITLRNYAIKKDFVPIASQGGVNFFIGNNARSDGSSAVVPDLGETWQYEDCVRIAEREEGRALKPSEVSGYWYGLGREFIRTQPGAAAKLFVRKFVLFWDRFELANNKDVYFFGRMTFVFRALSWLNFGVVAPLALVGMWVLARKRREGLLSTLFVFSYMFGILLFFVCARFRLPVVPYLIVFAVGGAMWILGRAARRRISAVVMALCALTLAAVFVNADFYGTHVGERAQTHYTIGLAHADRGRDEDALAEYLRAIELAPGYAKAHNNLGLTLERLGREEEAIQAYLAAVELDPRLASAPNNIGAVESRRGNHEEAVRWFEESIRRDPYRYEAHFNLGSLMVRLGDLERGEEHFRLAIVSNRTFKEAWNALGMLLEDTERLSESLAAYQTAVLLDSSYAEARNNLGVVLAKVGQLEDALTELERALRHAPGDRNVLANIDQVKELLSSRRRERGTDETGR